MDDRERWERIRALWEGDSLQDTTLLWRCLRKQADSPERMVELIAEAGLRDPAVEVEAETLAYMRAIATEATDVEAGA